MPTHDYGDIRVWNLRAARRKLLGGGAAGEVLTKLSAADGDFGWGAVAAPTSTPLLYVATATGHVISTMVETTVIGTGVGSLVIPANSTVPGNTLRAYAWGRLGLKATDSLTMRLKLGATSYATLGPWNTGALEAAGFVFEGEFTCTTLVTAIANSRLMLGSGAVIMDDNWFSLAYDPTVANTFDLTIEFSAASASDYISCGQFTLEKLA